MLLADLDGALEDVAEVRAAVGGAMAAIEIVDSRVADWDISYADTVADNASCGLLRRVRRRRAARPTSSRSRSS